MSAGPHWKDVLQSAALMLGITLHICHPYGGILRFPSICFSVSAGKAVLAERARRKKDVRANATVSEVRQQQQQICIAACAEKRVRVFDVWHMA